MNPAVSFDSGFLRPYWDLMQHIATIEKYQLIEHVYKGSKVHVEWNFCVYCVISSDFVSHAFHQVRDTVISGSVP